jgi:3-polyprenyl-4-hydroxybenzoate decarboxylase
MIVEKSRCILFGQLVIDPFSVLLLNTAATSAARNAVQRAGHVTIRKYRVITS